MSFSDGRGLLFKKIGYYWHNRLQVNWNYYYNAKVGTVDILFGQVPTFLKDSTAFVYELGGF